MVKVGPSHPCGRGQTTWTLTEKIGKFIVILSRPVHVAIKQTDLVGCLHITFFHLACRFEGKLLILGLFLDSILASQLRKAHFVSNLGGFLVTVPSLA